MRQLWYEIGIVGGALSLAMAIVAWLAPESLRSVGGAAVVGFLLGAGFHVGFEVTGLNLAYCRVGHACRSSGGG